MVIMINSWISGAELHRRRGKEKGRRGKRDEPKQGEKERERMFIVS